MSDEMYHERQSLQLCALHVVNSLWQRREFLKSELDEICLELAPESYSWWNPHRAPLGLGNYDVNVIMAALQRRGLDTVWFDKRR
jgi:josephin